MRKLFVFLILLVLLFPSAALAQEAGTVKIETLNVMLWSEHDQPSMLVIYNFTLTDDTQVPTSMDLRFPKDANITAVAYQSGGELLLANYQPLSIDDSNLQAIRLIVTERTAYHIEYYQPLRRNGEQRSFNYQWLGDFSVNEFDIEVQVPDDSKGVKTDPAIPLMQSQPSILSGGARMSALIQGQTYQLQLDYSRSSDTPVTTPSSSQVEPIVTVDENTDGRSTLDNLPLFLGGFGVALILAALFYFFRSGQSSVRAPKLRRRSNGPQESSMPSYCPECGTRTNAGDRFCRTCGSKLRGN